MRHSNFFEFLPPGVFSGFNASDWRGLQSPQLTNVHPAEMYAAPPAAAEVCSDVYGAYRAHAITKFLGYGSSLTPSIINPQYPSLLAMFYFLLGCCSMENRKDQQFAPCLQA